MKRKPGNPNIIEDGKSTRFPHNDPTLGGRPKIKPLRHILQGMEKDDFTIKIPIGQCEIHEDHVILKIPSKEYIARNLQTKAAKDVRWFQEWAKIMGEYSPDQFEDVTKDTMKVLELRIAKSEKPPL